MGLLKRKEDLIRASAAMQTELSLLNAAELQELIGSHVPFAEMQAKMKESPVRMEKQIRSIVARQEFAWLKGQFFSLQSYQEDITMALKGQTLRTRFAQYAHLPSGVPLHLQDAPSERGTRELLAPFTENLATKVLARGDVGLVDRFSLAFVTGCWHSQMPPLIRLMRENGLLMVQEAGSQLYIPTPEMIGVEKY